MADVKSNGLGLSRVYLIEFPVALASVRPAAVSIMPVLLSVRMASMRPVVVCVVPVLLSIRMASFRPVLACELPGLCYV